MTHEQHHLSRGGPVLPLAASLLLLANGIAAAQGNSPAQLRRFIDQLHSAPAATDGHPAASASHAAVSR